jgi:hypothetical protein
MKHYKGKKMKLSSRKELLQEAEIELSKIKESFIKENPEFMDKFRKKDFFTSIVSDKEKEDKKSPVKGIDYERWGEYIFDPDISQIDYKKLRKKDPTLPKEDPRNLKIFKEYPFAMEPFKKWLYFSDEYGSFAKRQNLLNGSKNSKQREELIKKLFPQLLTKRQSFSTDKYFNIYKLRDELPKDFVDLIGNKEKWGIIVRYLLAKFLYAIDPRDSGE